MQFYRAPPENGIGKILGQGVQLQGEKIKKGTEITESIAKKLQKNNFLEVYIAEFDEGDIEENQAAKLLGEKLAIRRSRLQLQKQAV